jgi:hypothetical protein
VQEVKKEHKGAHLPKKEHKGVYFFSNFKKEHKGQKGE